MRTVLLGILIPFLGTTAGASAIFFLKGGLHEKLQRALLGFAAGVMVAASVWSLLIPAMEMVSDRGRFAFLPALVGFVAGVAFLFLLDRITPHLHVAAEHPEGPADSVKRMDKKVMLVLAVTLHNIPEGMAVGVVLASFLKGGGTITPEAALALAIGIAIQNFPEGVIVSMPLRASGQGKMKSFFYGFFSGVVEPIAALITIGLTALVVPLLPYLLAFAAGAMVYVVVEELIPAATKNEESDICTIGFASGFALMMVLDVALG